MLLMIHVFSLHADNLFVDITDKWYPAFNLCKTIRDSQGEISQPPATLWAGEHIAVWFHGLGDEGDELGVSAWFVSFVGSGLCILSCMQSGYHSQCDGSRVGLRCLTYAFISVITMVQGLSVDA